MRRKLLYFTAAYAIGIGAASKLWDTFLFSGKAGISAAILLLTVLLLIAEAIGRTLYKPFDNLRRDGRVGFCFLIPILGVTLGMMSNALFLQEMDGIGPDTGAKPLEVLVWDVEKKDEGISIDALICNGNSLYRKHIYIRVYNGDAVDRGYDLIGEMGYYEGSLARPKRASNPGAFDDRDYCYGRGIACYGEVGGLRLRGEGNNPYLRFKRWVVKRREAFIKALDLEEDVEGLIRGVAFGMKDGIDEETYGEFRDVGTAHVLAVSGLHIGVIYALYIGISKKYRMKFLSPCFHLMMFAYGTAALWSPSVSRAIGLIFTKTLADHLERKWDGITALAFIALLELAVNPFRLFSVGFQMTYIAALGVFHLAPFLSRYISGGSSRVLGIYFFMAPYLVYRFNSLPLMAIPANIPVVALMSPMVIIVVPLFILYGLTGIYLTAAAPAVYGLAELMKAVNGLFLSPGAEAGGQAANIRGLAANLCSPPGWVMAAIYLFLIIVPSEFFQIRIVVRRDYGLLKRIILISVMAIMLSGNLTRSPFDDASLIFIDVGQGDGIHIDWGSMDILIDGGGRYDYNVGEKILKPYLLKNGNWDVDRAYATHLDMDHYKGLLELRECYPLKEIVTRGRKGEGMKVPESRKDKDGERSLEVLWPLEYPDETDEGKGAGENDRSLVIRIEDRGTTILITGDISSEVEGELLRIYGGTDKLKSDILKIAHHGSRYSSSEEFLREVDPMVAVISVGRNNYGHPAPQVIEKLESMDIMIYRTDLDGAVGIIVKEKGFAVCTKLTMRLNCFQRI